MAVPQLTAGAPHNPQDHEQGGHHEKFGNDPTANCSQPLEPVWQQPQPRPCRPSPLIR